MPLRRVALCVLLVLAASLAGLLGAEGVVAATRPLPLVGNEAFLGPRDVGSGPAYQLDDEMGFCPIAPGVSYTATGTLPNRYPTTKNPLRARLLFLGDSVTCRGRILRALQRIKANPHLELWNAGVESFDTVQSVLWYERKAHAVEPDLVMLTLHPNDLQGTSVSFLDEEGRRVLCRDGSEPQRVNRWLYESSHLYRRWLARPRGELPLEEAQARSLAAVKRLQARLAAEGIGLFVFAMPWCKPPAEWRAEDRARFEATRAVAAGSGAPWCDGLGALEEAVADGIVLDERPGDWWHPSDELAERFAAVCLEAGLLRPLVDLWQRRNASLEDAHARPQASR
jgi:hypothetical protein